MRLPATTALLLIDAPKAYSGRYTPFGIPIGREGDAATELIGLLKDGFEVSLSNDGDEGGEGCTTIRHHAGGFQTKVGGHGWQGNWTATSEVDIRSIVVGLAPLNRGPHWQCCGSITGRT